MQLANLNCSKLNFQPGDRILVRVRQPLDANARKRIKEAVEKWSGKTVPVMVADPRMEIEVIQAFRGGADIQ